MLHLFLPFLILILVYMFVHLVIVYTTVFSSLYRSLDLRRINAHSFVPICSSDFPSRDLFARNSCANFKEFLTDEYMIQFEH